MEHFKKHLIICLKTFSLKPTYTHACSHTYRYPTVFSDYTLHRQGVFGTTNTLTDRPLEPYASFRRTAATGVRPGVPVRAPSPRTISPGLIQEPLEAGVGSVGQETPDPVHLPELPGEVISPFPFVRRRAG